MISFKRTVQKNGFKNDFTTDDIKMKESNTFKIDDLTDCKIERLPNELLCKIFFNYLTWNDHIQLSKISKRFYSIIQSKPNKFKELAIFLNQIPTPSEVFFFGNKLISYSNFVRLSSLICLFREEFWKKFKDIEYLLIINNSNESIQSTKIDFNDKIFNQFVNLKQLELRNIHQIKGKLELPNLERFYRLQSNFIIECQNLIEIAYFDKARPRIVHTKNLTTLASQQLSEPYIGYGFLNKSADCLNLKKLIAYEVDQIRWVINKFKNQLKEVNCINQIRVREIYDLIKNVDDSKLNGLELFYFGINMKNKSFKQVLNDQHIESIFYIQNLDSEFVKIFSNNFFDFKDAMPYIKEIIVDNAVAISDEFASKLINLQTLTIQSTDEEKKLDSIVLTKFMDRSNKLLKLNLELIEIDQWVIDQMPSKFPLLKELKIKDCRLDNLDFVYHFHGLETFITNCDLNIKQTLNLLLQCCPVKIIFINY